MADSAEGADGTVLAYHGRMTNPWGNDDHGPGGEPSWLGGQDRGGGADGAGSWTSDFSSDVTSGPAPADSDFGARRDPLDAEEMAPRFGKITGDEARGSSREPQPTWTSGFGEQSGTRTSSGRPLAAQLFGVFSSSIIFIIVAVVFFRSGFDMWWIIFIVCFPLISRVGRIIRRHRGD